MKLAPESQLSQSIPKMEYIPVPCTQQLSLTVINLLLDQFSS